MRRKDLPDIDRIDWSHPREALELLARHVDACHDARDHEGSKRALAVANGLDVSTWRPLDRGRLEYIKANICSDLFHQPRTGSTDSLPWTHPYLDPQILSWRKAISATNEAKEKPVWTIQAYTNLANTLDYPVYALASEKVKAAYRMCYSLFDRIALLVDDYFELGHPERRLSFKSVWYRDGERKKGLHPSLDGRLNWPLRGLHWLSKDLFEQEEGFRESLSPDARELKEIRNAIEQRMLRLHMWESPRLDGDPFPKRRRLGRSVVYREFEAKSLRLIKLVRAAIIFTVLAMGQEERAKKEADDSGKPTLPMITDVWEDDWKTTH